MGNVNIELPEELHRKMKIACALTSDTIIEFVNKSLDNKLSSDKEIKGMKEASQIHK